MKRLTVLVSLVAMLALAALGTTAAPAGAYGGGADHDMWQIGLSTRAVTAEPLAAPPPATAS
jgi:hypothetical protein